jgi:outer membrane protein, heavy metal efflux system
MSRDKHPHPILRTALLLSLLTLGGAARAEPISLRQALQAAFEHNAELRLAAAGVAGAEAGVALAGATPNPTLTLQTFNINPGAGVGPGGLRSKTVDSAVRLDQLIERGGKRALRLDGAHHQKAASEWDLREARRQLRLAVSQAYYELLAARTRLDIARANAELFDSTVAAAQKRRRAGDLAPADVARAEVDALRARNDAVQAESDLFAARQGLAVLIGQEQGAAALDAGDDWPAASAAPEAEAETEAAVQRRPDVQAAQARIDAALAARALALAARTRDVTVGVQAEHFPASAGNAQGSGNSYGVALQIPVFIGNTYRGEIAAAEAALDAARVGLDKARTLARSDLALARERAASAGARWRRYDAELLAAARRSSEAAEFAFRHGALGIMDLLDVRRTYRAAQLEALGARTDYAKSLAALQAAAWKDE